MFVKLSLVVSVFVHHTLVLCSASDMQFSLFVSQSPKCGRSQPVMSVSVRSRIQCVNECQHRTNQYQQLQQLTPCIGVNYRDTEAACDVFDQEPTSYSEASPGCQYIGLQFHNQQQAHNSTTEIETRTITEALIKSSYATSTHTVTPMITTAMTTTDSCLVELRSWGYDDTSDWIGYIRINDEMIVDFTSDYDSFNGDIRGINTILIRSSTCNSYDYHTFDTSGPVEASDALAEYLSSLPNGTVIAGLTIDDAKMSLTDDAKNALSAIGVNITQLQYHGKLTFVAMIGQPQLTQYSYAGCCSDNLLMNASVNRLLNASSYTNNGSCLVEIRSWGYDDMEEWISYFRVNGDMIVNYTSTPDSYNSYYQGMNTILIRSSTCNPYDYRTFNTNSKIIKSDALAQYLSSLPNGTVIAGLTLDDATYSLTDDAKSALLAIGVNITQLQYHGKMTFVATIGQPQFTQYRCADSGGDNLKMNASVTRSPTSD